MAVCSAAAKSATTPACSRIQAVPTVIVISTAVPKVATVLIKPSSARFATKPKRNASSPGPDGAGALEPVSPT